MEIQECINNRRTIRDFSCLHVPKEIIGRAVQAGLKAPSYNHLKQWDFILVKEQNKRIALTHAEEMKEEVTEDLKKRLKGMIFLLRKCTWMQFQNRKKWFYSTRAISICLQT